jgi:hypothetical protein
MQKQKIHLRWTKYCSVALTSAPLAKGEKFGMGEKKEILKLQIRKK